VVGLLTSIKNKVYGVMTPMIETNTATTNRVSGRGNDAGDSFCIAGIVSVQKKEKAYLKFLFNPVTKVHMSATVVTVSMVIRQKHTVHSYFTKGKVCGSCPCSIHPQCEEKVNICHF
jgi:hypothetical protein